jgi:DNA-binding NtrC family response regulator
MAIATIMLVDDEIPFVEAMTKRLTRRDLVVEQAFSGKDALEQLIDGSKAEVVILDVKMPGMDGIEALQAIKRKVPLVEVIMLTGHATVESAIEGMKMGAFRLPVEAMRHGAPDRQGVRSGCQETPARGKDHQCPHQGNYGKTRLNIARP